MNGQGLYFDDPTRSPGTQHRQSSRQAPFEQYGRSTMGNSAFYNDDSDARFDLGRASGLDRLNTNIGGNGGYNNFDQAAAQTWNPSAFANNGFAPSGLGPISRTTRQQPGRRNLPSGWMDAPQMNVPGMPQFASNNMPPPNMNGGRMGGGYEPDVDDELIPTAIVIKNIPFAVRKEELVDVMTHLNLPLPYAFNYHFDNGVFRGLAFANFTSAEETGIVIDSLNHYELNGRKLRVEYKKMLPVQERERIEREKRERRGQLEEQHRPMATPSLHNPPSMSSLNSSRLAATSPSPVDQRGGIRQPGMPAGTPMMDYEAPDLNDPQTLQFYNELLVFKSDTAREMLIFPSTLSATHRRIVHTLCHMMNLGHQSTGSGDQRQVYVQKTTGPGSSVSPPLQQSSMLAPDPSRRTLNRSATTDFSEARALETNLFNDRLRGQHSTGFLGPPESPGGFGNSANLRAAKSFADLRSYTPSPAPSTASYPVNTGHAQRGNERTNDTPTITPTTSNNPLMQQQRSNEIMNSFGNLTLDNSPRRVRPVFSWDQGQGQAQGGPSNPSPAPIGSNRVFSTNSFEDASSRITAIRQPRGPAQERGAGFGRARQNGHGIGHQQRGSDELSQRGQQQGSQQGGNVEIIVEH